jgi:hypothetical protein
VEPNISGRKIRRKILSEFYASAYQRSFFESDIQGYGIDWFERALEKFWITNSPDNVLEMEEEAVSILST